MLSEHNQGERGQDELRGDQRLHPPGDRGDGHLQHALLGDTEGGEAELAPGLIPLRVPVSGLY